RCPNGHKYRIRKPLSKKTVERVNLASSIESKGSDADMPCTWCFRKGLKCLRRCFGVVFS
ncbi:hypothetical protein BJF96_g6996, partial [Verticillium dahliae]